MLAGRPLPFTRTSQGATAEPADRTDRDCNCGWTSILIGVVFGGLAMFYSLFLYAYLNRHQLHGYHFWWAPGDIWSVVDGGRFVWHGALGYAYSQGNSYALPLSFILSAPVAAVIDHFNLVEGIVPLARPSAWLVAGPFSLLFGVFLLDAVRRLAWDLGLRKRLWAVQVLTVVIALAPGFEWGHFEDVLALVFVVHAVRYVIADQPVRAAAVISLAISSKQWAVMLLPFLLLVTPVGRRLRGAIAGCALPALLTGLVLLVGGHRAIQQLFEPVNMGKDATGHASFYLTWLGNKTSEASRSVGLILTVPIAWLFRKARTPAIMLAAMSILMLIRPFFEAISYSYYWPPALLLAGMVGVATHRRFRIRDWIWQVPAILWALPHGNYSTATLWWAVMLVPLVATYLQVAFNCGVRLPIPRMGRADHPAEAPAEEVVTGEPASAY